MNYLTAKIALHYKLQQRNEPVVRHAHKVNGVNMGRVKIVRNARQENIRLGVLQVLKVGAKIAI